MQKITTFLWFDNQAEEAANLYVSLFDDSKILSITRNGDQAFLVNFQLGGVEYTAMNAGPMYKFNEAISLAVRCTDQAEVDNLWAKLTADGGEESMCGWLKDKFGLSWQIVPQDLGDYLYGADPEGAGRAMQAMLQMRKLDLAALQAAYEGE